MTSGAPLAELADATLDLAVGPKRAVPATKTFTAQVAALAMLAEALGQPLWTPADWRPLPTAQEAMLADPGPATEAAAMLGATARSVHLGRGLLYAIALERALKLAETSSLPASGFSSADFLHGPVAVSPATAVVAYLAPGPVAEDVRQAAAAARDAGAPADRRGASGRS
jgi:glucosamine--fructose-6-phosphate aminotransferase (isomerizing)